MRFIKKIIIYININLFILIHASTDFFQSSSDTFENQATFEPLQDFFQETTFINKNSQPLTSTPNKIPRPNIRPKTSILHTLSTTSNANVGPMLLNLPTNPTINTNVIDDTLFKQCLQLVEFLYQSTKRYAPDQLVFPGNLQSHNSSNAKTSLYKTLRNQNIIIATPLQGTNGGLEGSDIGLLAYKKLEQKHKIQLFIVLEGSQGEAFEFLGGLGGASWRTNLQAHKKNNIPAQNLNISSKYLLNGDGKLSFHSGYYNKIFTSKIYFERCIENLFSLLNIQPFEVLGIKDDNLDAATLQRTVDQKRNLSIDVYIFGHSQGGGLTQVAAPYYTTFIGEYLYGKNFDNKTFNTAHAICLSPARAIGDPYTWNVIKNVLGEGNIFGYSSDTDIVTCVPLGQNVDLSPVKKYGLQAMLNILKAISYVLPSDLSELAKTIASVSTHYETLPIFGYESTDSLIDNYCKYSIESLNQHLKALNQSNYLPVESITYSKFDLEKFKKDQIKSINDKIKSLQETQKNLKNLRNNLRNMKTNYFKAHTSNVFISNYYIALTAKNLYGIFKICPIYDFIASQHFGSNVFIEFDVNKQTYFFSNALFNYKLLKGNLQEAINNGVEYERNKQNIIAGK